LQGQLYDERRAFTDNAFHPYLTAQHCAERLDDIEPQTNAFEAARSGIIHLMEPIEYFIALVPFPSGEKDPKLIPD